VLHRERGAGGGGGEGRISRFVDVNYRIVPFTGQTRSFFSWPLIPSNLLLTHHPILLFSPLSLCPSIYLPPQHLARKDRGLRRARGVKRRVVIRCAGTKVARIREFRAVKGAGKPSRPILIASSLELAFHYTRVSVGNSLVTYIPLAAVRSRELKQGCGIKTQTHSSSSRSYSIITS